MGHVAHGLGSMDVGTVLKQVVKISIIFTSGAMLFDFVVIYSVVVSRDSFEFRCGCCLKLQVLRSQVMLG